MRHLLLPAIFLSIAAASFAQPKPLNELYGDLAVKKDTAYINTLLHIGITHRNTNKLDSAEFYFNEMVKRSGPLKYELGKYSATVCLGDVYIMRANYDSAKKNDNLKTGLVYYTDALKQLETASIPDKNKSAAKVYGRIGQIYMSQNDIAQALKYLKDGEQSLQNSTDTLGILDINHALVYCYRMQGDTTTAYRYLEKGLSLLDNLERSRGANPQMMKYINKVRIVHINNALDENIGDHQTNASINDRCLAILEKIWTQKETLPDDLTRCAVLSNIGTLNMAKGNYQKAIEYSNQALKDYPGVELYKHSLYKNLARSYFNTGDYKLAYENYDLYNQQYEARYQKEKFAAIQELQTKYETEKKESEIVVLNKEKRSQQFIIGLVIAGLLVALGLLVFALRANRLQKKLFAKEKELQRKEMEKRMFELEQTALRAQMNPHFIFNSLNSVQRFVINNDAEGVNKYLSTFANLIRQTLENSGKQLIPLKDELRYLETYLRLEQMRGNEKFKYSISVNPDIDPDETYIPNMIIQPYLENSVIHGMAGKKTNEGLINLTISKNHKLTCIVEDNGAGITASRSFKKETESNHESMGTAITEKRIEMFNTINSEKIEIEVLDKSELTSRESGTRIRIQFPINTSAN
jgi:tetratricopeptide (TPR) repeat protein